MVVSKCLICDNLLTIQHLGEIDTTKIWDTFQEYLCQNSLSQLNELQLELQLVQSKVTSLIASLSSTIVECSSGKSCDQNNHGLKQESLNNSFDPGLTAEIQVDDRLVAKIATIRRIVLNHFNPQLIVTDCRRIRKRSKISKHPLKRRRVFEKKIQNDQPSPSSFAKPSQNDDVNIDHDASEPADFSTGLGSQDFDEIFNEVTESANDSTFLADDYLPSGDDNYSDNIQEQSDNDDEEDEDLSKKHRNIKKKTNRNKHRSVKKDKIEKSSSNRPAKRYAIEVSPGKFQYDRWTYTQLEIGFKCDTCFKLFKSKRTSNQHIRKQHLAREGNPHHNHNDRHKRRNIGVVTVSPGNFMYQGDWPFIQIDNDTTTSWSSTFFQCSTCKKVHKTKAGIVSHIQTSHSFPSSFRCGSCSRSFKNQMLLDRHQCGVRTSYGQVLDCGEGKFSYLYDDMVFHFEITTTDKFKCGLCQLEQRGQENITRHIRSRHAGCSWVCHLCGKSFSEQRYLQDHLFIHSDVKLLCQECGRTFKTKHELRKHLRLNHQQQLNNNFQCDICQKFCKTAPGLEQHKYWQHDRQKGGGGL